MLPEAGGGEVRTGAAQTPLPSREGSRGLGPPGDQA